MFNFFNELKKKYLSISNKICPYQMVMMGDYLLYVEGNVTIMTLSTNNIVFKLKDCICTVCGMGLGIKEITENTLTIIGKISQIERV